MNDFEDDAANAEQWRAVLARDAAADGAFVFAVRTTRIYCRPSCPARRPKRTNVQFFKAPAAARDAGYRACRRCRPDEPPVRTALVQRLCRLIDEAPSPPSLAALAAHAGLSAFHVQRVFRQTVGVTPRAYAAARRAQRVRNELGAGASVTAAMHRAGYGSSGRFYAEADARLGMLPKSVRSGGAGEQVDYTIAPCSLGKVLVATTQRGIVAILLGDDDRGLEDELAQRLPRAERRRSDRSFAARLARVIAFVDGERADPGLPLDVRGTAFQQRVWECLLRIPRGSTTNYTAIARELGLPRGARAVARAVATNALAIVVPCHRVVRSDGELAGYRWGVPRKRALLAREGAARQDASPE